MKEEEKQEKEMKKILKKRAQLTIYMKITSISDNHFEYETDDDCNYMISF